MDKRDIRDISFQDLTNFLVNKDIKKFRAKQICDFVYKKNVQNFDDIKNLSKKDIEIIKQEFVYNKLEVVSSKTSSDGTVKFAFKLFDGNIIESVLIVGSSRTTACVSTQVGCTVNCSFCATGTLSYKRNLTAGEIFEQAFILKQYAEENNLKFTNIVYMGMGEPFLNYDNVILSLKHISSPDYSIGFSARRITISTSGIIPGIDKFANEDTNANLAISLHSAIDENRSKLMPINKKYNLEKLSESLSNFNRITKKRITIEYLLLKGENDTMKDVRALLDFCKSFPVKINIIEYNPVDGIDYQTTSDETTNFFATEMEKRNLVVNVRKSKGKDIDAACGQLANKLINNK
jgi:23S rRNA (adenine2503-C2)-methyltransferase